MKYLVIALALLATPAAAEDRFYSYGGTESCAAWQATSTDQVVGNWWIWGFWSGMNAANKSGVGFSTDGAGIIGEVKLYCDAHPADSLATATDVVYSRMKAAGR